MTKEMDQLAEKLGVSAWLSCDHPQCECSYECERNDKHEQFIRELADERGIVGQQTISEEK